MSVASGWCRPRQKPEQRRFIWLRRVRTTRSLRSSFVLVPTSTLVPPHRSSIAVPCRAVLGHCSAMWAKFDWACRRTGDNSSTTPLHYAAVKGTTFRNMAEIRTRECSRYAHSTVGAHLQETPRLCGFSSHWAPT